MISKDKILEYMLINEKARYEAIKALTVAFKHICISVIICLTIVACCYMYLVVPVETEDISVSGDNTRAVLNNKADRGSQLWVSE